MQRYILVKEKLSMRHLAMLYKEEVGEELLEEWMRAREAVRYSFLSPVVGEVVVNDLRLSLPYGLSCIVDSYGYISVLPEPIMVKDCIDHDFIRYLLYDLPKMLDEDRRPVLVEGFDERFTKNAVQGLIYAGDILKRVGIMYRVPVAVKCCINTLGYLKWVNTYIIVKREGRTYLQQLPENIYFEVRDYE